MKLLKSVIVLLLGHIGLYGQSIFLKAVLGTEYVKLYNLQYSSDKNGLTAFPVDYKESILNYGVRGFSIGYSPEQRKKVEFNFSSGTRYTSSKIFSDPTTNVGLLFLERLKNNQVNLSWMNYPAYMIDHRFQFGWGYNLRYRYHMNELAPFSSAPTHRYYKIRVHRISMGLLLRIKWVVNQLVDLELSNTLDLPQYNTDYINDADQATKLRRLTLLLEPQINLGLSYRLFNL